MELGSSGGALRACRCGGMGARGALESCCRRAGVEVWSSGALEVRCRRADVEVWCRRRSMEVSSSGTWEGRSGALEAYCRRAGVKF